MQVAVIDISNKFSSKGNTDFDEQQINYILCS